MSSQQDVFLSIPKLDRWPNIEKQGHMMSIREVLVNLQGLARTFSTSVVRAQL